MGSTSEEHLSFEADGTIRGLTPEGRTSVSTLNLNARKLRKARKCVVDAVVRLLEDVEELGNHLPDPRAQKRLLRIGDDIRQKMDDKAQFAATARAVVGDPPAFGA